MVIIKNIKISEYNTELKGIIKYNKLDLVVPKTIVGEEVSVEIINNKSRLSAKLLKVQKPSVLRIKPKCLIYNQCGGCTIQHIKYEEQLNLKTNIIKKLFLDELKFQGKINDTIGMRNPTHYRNKNQMVYKNIKGKIVCGFYEEGTHSVIQYDQCLIQDPTSDQIAQTIKLLMNKMRINAYDEDRKVGIIRHVLIKHSNTTNEVMVVIVIAQELFPGRNNFIKALLEKHPNITTIIQNINNRKTSAILGNRETVLYGKGYIFDMLLGKKFKISSKSFYQINSLQTEKLYTSAIQIANLSKNDVLLDTYCGVGTIGLIASELVKQVIGVEIVKEAVNDAIYNAKNNNIKNCHFIQADASLYMNDLSKENKVIDVVMMDPPRSGSDEQFLQALLKLSPKKIIYISCNPLTQVRDLKTLLKGSYSIKHIQPVDMFPQTSHIENIVYIEKNNILNN